MDGEIIITRNTYIPNSQMSSIFIRVYIYYYIATNNVAVKN